MGCALTIRVTAELRASRFTMVSLPFFKWSDAPPIVGGTAVAVNAPSRAGAVTPTADLHSAATLTMLKHDERSLRRHRRRRWRDGLRGVLPTGPARGSRARPGTIRNP